MEFKRGIVAIQSHPDSEKILGTGFFVASGVILTCAHVIEDYYQPDMTAYFKLDGQGKTLGASVPFYSPKEEFDIAVLQPKDKIDYFPLRLTTSQNSRQHNFSVFGYPEVSDIIGFNGAGKILGRTKRKQGYDILQLDSRQITHGFSGAPVWDEELQGVVGILLQGIKAEDIGKPSFALPSETLITVLKDKFQDLELYDRDAEMINQALSRQQFEPEPWIQTLSITNLTKQSKSDDLQRFLDILEKEQKVVLVGASGSGKTSTMKMAVNEFNENPNRKCFRIPLENYENSLNYTIKITLGWHNLQDDQVINYLEKYRIILLLDGLNEVTIKDQDKCINEIKSLLNTYQGQVCVSYPISDHTYFNFEYPTYKLLPLSKDQIKKIVEDFFKAKGMPDKGEWFLQTIRGWDTEKQKDFDKLAELPINLKFLLELADDDRFVFNSRRDLFGQLIQMRLRKQKNNTQRNKISIEIKTDCLMSLAYQAIIKDQPLQMQKEFVRSIVFDVSGLTKLEADLALQETIRAGLLIERSDFLIEWPHASFRDYLAGRQLFKLVETDQIFDEFPLDKHNGFSAAAHATRLLTTQSRKIEKRPVIFLSVLQKHPNLEVMKAVADEFHIAFEYYSSTGQNLECDKNIFVKTKWGERFLETCKLVKDIAYKSGLPGVENIPSPQGLKVFFDSASYFCLIVFSDDEGIEFDKLETFNAQISRRKRRKRTKTGFCLYAPFLLLLDPEIVAYLEVGLWLKMKANNTGDKFDEWHNDLAIYISPNNKRTYWSQPQELPEPGFELCASPQDTMNILINKYGSDQVNQIKRTMDIKIHSKKEFLSWQEIYMPITFQIDPSKTKGTPQIVFNRLSQIMVQMLPEYHISLLILSSSIGKIDKGINIFIPFPISLLNRYYYLYNQHIIFNNGILGYFHLHG